MRLASVGLALVLLLGTADPVMTGELPRSREDPTDPFSLGAVRWQHRVLVLSAKQQDHPALREQLSAVEASRAQFDDRDLLLVVLLEDAQSTAGGRPLTSSEAEQLRAEVGIPVTSFALRLVGKDVGVKLARGKPVPMEEIYALIDTMPMRQSEMER